MSSRNSLLAMAALAWMLSMSARAEVIPLTKIGLQVDPATRFQLRCWQQGRLIIDEHDVALPGDIKLDGARIRGRNRGQQPVYVVEARSAVCFVKPMAAGAARSTLPFHPAR
jgi:hypothetical protein